MSSLRIFIVPHDKLANETHCIFKNVALKITWDATEVLVEETEETGSPLKNTPVMPGIKFLKKLFCRTNEQSTDI